jgi:hypothetical protein
MQESRILTGGTFLGLVLVASLCGSVCADVAPGEVIDKSNWEKAEGLLPEPALNWVKNGDIVLKVGQLNFDPKDFRNPGAKASLEVNAGKYDLDANDLFVEKSTGAFPNFVEGIPFPESALDEKDPRLGAKVMYNKFYSSYTQGNLRFPFGTIWVARVGGLEREVQCEWQQYPMDGFAGHKDESNKEGYERFALIRVLAPFDIAGTNILLMRYRGEKQDTTLAYVPAIRRVRRMSPANRSDSFIGSDACVDDAWCFDGKVIAFTWKLLRTQEALFPFLAEDPQPLDAKGSAEYWTGKSMRQIHYGYEDKDWQGAPWMPTNLIWVKRKAFVLEMSPKDPYYNYGTQYMWVDTDVNLMTFWKVIYDRANKYWKMMWYSWSVFQSPDDKMRLVVPTSMLAVDDRTNHGTVIRFPEPNNNWGYFVKLNKNDYSLGGFQKLCK